MKKGLQKVKRQKRFLKSIALGFKPEPHNRKFRVLTINPKVNTNLMQTSGVFKLFIKPMHIQRHTLLGILVLKSV